MFAEPLGGGVEEGSPRQEGVAACMRTQSAATARPDFAAMPPMAVRSHRLGGEQERQEERLIASQASLV